MLHANNSFALGKLGHKLVCQLSFDLLSINNQEKIQTLINKIPKKHQQLINRFNHQSKNNQLTYADTCTWADAVKKLDDYKKYNAWHYLNVRRNSTKVTQQSCLKNCITHAILFHQQQLAVKNNNWQRTQALMFISHWVADIHQPLHVSFASDRGGNNNKITMLKENNKTIKCRNLHWLWDECLLYPLSENLSAKQLHQKLLPLLTLQLKNIPRLTQKKWQQENIWQWATESLLIARRPDVHYCHKQQHECLSLSSQKLKLSKDYHQLFSPVLQKRVLQAAIRLTNLLEKSL